MNIDVLPEEKTLIVDESDLERLHRIILHNDHATPMDFVVEILKRVFFLANDRAAQIMFLAHIKGSAYVQSLPQTEAEKRVQRAHHLSGVRGYPLHFSLEVE